LASQSVGGGCSAEKIRNLSRPAFAKAMAWQAEIAEITKFAPNDYFVFFVSFVVKDAIICS
jgi:hypothetical protein